MARTGPPTVLFDVFWAHQKRERLIEQALAGTDLPPEDYPLYVLIGAEGPWTPTGLAARLGMPRSTTSSRSGTPKRRLAALCDSRQQPVLAYVRSLHPQLPRPVWLLQVGGLTNAFGNGIVLPFLIIYLHN